MSTTILDHREFKELQPAYGLWKQYMPEKAAYRFPAEGLDKAERLDSVKVWQR